MRGENLLGMPPILYTCSMTYFPLGLRSAMKGIRSETRWKSSIVSVIPTERAIGIKCSTAFVEPPRIIVRTCNISESADFIS